MKKLIAIVIILILTCAAMFADETGAGDATDSPPSPPVGMVQIWGGS